VDFVAKTTVSLSSSLKRMVAFQFHPIAHITILECSIKNQQSSAKLIHAQMCQFIALYAPLLSLVILPPYGNIMFCIIKSVNIPLEAPLHQFQGSYWFKCLSLRRRKGLWVFQNTAQLTGGGRTIFQIVMGFSWGKQEKDLTLFQQPILIVMTKKGTN
jgi:hypothetical protein